MLTLAWLRHISHCPTDPGNVLDVEDVSVRDEGNGVYNMGITVTSRKQPSPAC